MGLEGSGWGLPSSAQVHAVSPFPGGRCAVEDGKKGLTEVREKKSLFEVGNKTNNYALLPLQIMDEKRMACKSTLGRFMWAVLMVGSSFLFGPLAFVEMIGRGAIALGALACCQKEFAKKCMSHWVVFIIAPLLPIVAITVLCERSSDKKADQSVDNKGMSVPQTNPWLDEVDGDAGG